METSPAPKRFWFAASEQMHGAATIGGLTESYCGVQIPQGTVEVRRSPSRPGDPPLCPTCMITGLLAAVNVLPRMTGGN
ncbi:MAG: hypothetical protein J2P23_07890 [Microlunatus sp.]|nr:hypothetical protein [Microlunatus sp.]